jgi:hypothetical protein
VRLVVVILMAMAGPRIALAGDADRAPVGDPVARLQQRIDSGKVKLAHDEDYGYLKSVLRELHVPAESQSLVFSKTSFQSQKISPQTPRAVYFSDDLYIGFVQGGDVIEVASVDPEEGPVFYLLSQNESDRPKFARDTTACAQCHQTARTGSAMGLLMRSVYPDANGFPDYGAGTFDTTDQSPASERWGGWYMDGKIGRPSMANGIRADASHPDKLDGAGPTELARRFDLSPYLTPHSDALALTVLAHQTNLHNLMTRAAIDITTALRDEAAVKRAMGDTSPQHTESTLSRIKSVCDPIVEAMLFCGAADLGPIESSSGFAKGFESLGPRDRRGRSLRDFDLKHRLFRYPCSYLIYSAQFDALPEPVQEYIYRRLWKVLTGRDDSKQFSHLSDADRNAIYGILFDTKKGLPAYWKSRY